MSREVKRFYRPRIQVPVGDAMNQPGEYGLFCLSLDGVSILSRLTGYAHRKITYIDEPISSSEFWTVSDEDLESIRDTVLELEVGLMSPCAFDEIVASIDALNASVQALQCICSNMQSERSTNILGEDVVQSIEDGVLIPSGTIPSVTIPSQTDIDACAIAQLYFAATYELMTELVLPAARSTFDNLVPVTAGVIAGMIATPAVGLAMYAVAETVQELLELGYVVAEENYRNWLWSVRDNWVCTAYYALLDGGTSHTIASSVYDAIVEPSTSISVGDKVATALFGGALAVNVAKKAYDDVTAWSIENWEFGFCSDCRPYDTCLDIGPCVLTDWVGGTWSCAYGSRATLTGGNGYHAPTSIDCPAVASKLTVAWSPKDVGGGSVGSCTLGVHDNNTGVNVPLGTTPSRIVDNVVVEEFSIPPGQWGHNLSLWCKQESNGCQPKFWCVSEA